MSCLVLGAAAGATAQEIKPKDVPDGPAPVVEAAEEAAAGRRPA